MTAIWPQQRLTQWERCLRKVLFSMTLHDTGNIAVRLRLSAFGEQAQHRRVRISQLSVLDFIAVQLV